MGVGLVPHFLGSIVISYLTIGFGEHGRQFIRPLPRPGRAASRPSLWPSGSRYFLCLVPTRCWPKVLTGVIVRTPMINPRDSEGVAGGICGL
jgi:hypothetical protein